MSESFLPVILSCTISSHFCVLLVPIDVRVFAPFLRSFSWFWLSTVEVWSAHSCQFRGVILFFLLFSLKLWVDLAWVFFFYCSFSYEFRSPDLERVAWLSVLFLTSRNSPWSSHQCAELAAASWESQLAPPHPTPMSVPPSLSFLCLCPVQLWVELKQFLLKKAPSRKETPMWPSHKWADPC